MREGFCVDFRGRVIFSIGRRGMIWAVEGNAPFFSGTAIAASAGLLRDEEANIVVEMVCRVKASCTHHPAVVQRTIPG